jgi:hypothetical protein
MALARRGIARSVVVFALLSPRVMAQPTAADKAAAEALFEEGRALLDKQPEQACAKFEASQELDAGLGTLLYLADCYERVGKTASAWATYLEAAAIAKERGQADRMKVARTRAAALEPKLSKLTVTTSEAHRIAGFELRDNGRSVPQASWNVALPVDPGSHLIEAMAPGRKPWSTTIDVPAGGASQRLDVPELAALPEERPATQETPVERETPMRAPPVEADAAPTSGSGQRTVGLILGGVGVVGIGVGSFFGLNAISKNDDSLDECTTKSLCNETGVNLRNEAKDAATISTIAFVAGGALLTTGIVLYLTAPSGQESARRGVHIAAGAEPGSVALRIGGDW